MAPEHYDETSAGIYLGGKRPISPRTLQRWRASGEGPEFVRIGHAVRYTKEALDRFIKEGTRSSTCDGVSAA